MSVESPDLSAILREELPSQAEPGSQTVATVATIEVKTSE